MVLGSNPRRLTKTSNSYLKHGLVAQITMSVNTQNTPADHLIASNLYAQLVPELDHLTFSNTLTSQIQDLLLATVSSDRSKETVSYYNEFLSRFAKYCNGQGITDARQARANHIRLYLLYLKQHMKPASVDAHYRAIRRLFRWLKREETIDKNPMEKVDRPTVPNNIITPFNSAQFHRLLAVCDSSTLCGARDRAILLMFAGTGIRRLELFNIQLNDIDTTLRRIKIMGKGSKERYIGLNDVIIAALVKYLSYRKDKLPCLWVSGNRRGQPIKEVHAITDIMQRAGKLAGITGVRCSPHTLRHTFGTIGMESGMDPGNVQTLMGHETNHMTRRYTKTVLNKIALKQQATINPLDYLLKDSGKKN